MSQAVRRALYGKMVGDSTLMGLANGTTPTGYNHAVYYQVAPKGAGYPFIVFHKQASTPTHAMKGGANAIRADVWLIRGVARDMTADAVDAIASRLDALLTDGVLSISGGTQLWLRPDSDFDFSDTTDGVVYRESGAFYRLLYSAP